MPTSSSSRTLAVLFASVMVSVGIPPANAEMPSRIPPPLTVEAPVAEPGTIPPPLPRRDTPPPLPAPALSAFFVDTEGEPEGPFTAQQIIGRIQAGQITPQTLVWKRGAPNWVRAGEITEFVAAFRGAPPPMRRDPQLQRIEHALGSGEILFGRFPEAASARAVAARVLQGLKPDFERGPEPLAAVGDARDHEIHVSFGAQAEGQVRSGLLVVRVHPGGAAAGVVHDASVVSAQSLPRLLATLDRHMPAAAPAPDVQNWRRVPFPDGSGSVELPDGWQVVASSKGMADIVGPDGGYAALGIWTPVIDPAMAMQMQQMLGSTPGVVAPYSDPLSALQQVFPYLDQGVSQRQVTRIIGQAPVTSPAAGQAAYIDFEYRTTDFGGTHDRRGVTLVITMPGYGQWVYYSSMVSSPVQNFEELLPTMARIWESYQVAGQVLRERLDTARRDLAEVDRILRESEQTRQASIDRIAANWTEVLRNQTVIEDSLLDERHHDAPLAFVNELVDDLNQQVGYERYRHVPLRDLR